MHLTKDLTMAALLLLSLRGRVHRQEKEVRRAGLSACLWTAEPGTRRPVDRRASEAGSGAPGPPDADRIGRLGLDVGALVLLGESPEPRLQTLDGATAVGVREP